MRPAGERLSERLAGVSVRSPRIPVIHNVDLSRSGTPEEIRERLVRQVSSPVRWVETVEAMQAAGVTRIVECGPGKVLAGLVRRIQRDLEALAITDPASLDKALADGG